MKILWVAFLFVPVSHAVDELKKSFVPPTCTDELHRTRAGELAKIFQTDQADRAPLEGRSQLKGDPQETWKKVALKDLERRKRVGEMFGEGCISTADDYYHAAMVYQHGMIPDHFFQAYIWASRSVELGNKDAKWLSGASLDRYLMNLGYKQIYATQAKTPDNDPATCWCLWPVEDTATEDLRRSFGTKTIAEQMRWLESLNKDKKGCKPSFCAVDAKPVSKNGIAGVSW